jgi:hypothetical protein
METLLIPVLFILGVIGGLFAGLLGIGGGIIMVPLLLYVPPSLGFAAMDMRAIAGITMVQSLGGSVSAALIHNKNQFINTSLVLYTGGAGMFGALAGSIYSKYLSADFMLGLFAALAFIASGLLFLRDPDACRQEKYAATDFNKAKAVLLGLLVGIIGGIIGQGGAFLIIPLMLYSLRIPVRIALGSSVAISLLSALAGFVGKWGTEQIPLLLAFVLTVGAILGAQIGGRISKRLKTTTLRAVLAILISGTALRIGFSLLSGLGISAVVLDIAAIAAIVCVAYLTFRMRYQRVEARL